MGGGGVNSKVKDPFQSKGPWCEFEYVVSAPFCYNHRHPRGDEINIKSTVFNFVKFIIFILGWVDRVTGKEIKLCFERIQS